MYSIKNKKLLISFVFSVITFMPFGVFAQSDSELTKLREEAKIFDAQAEVDKRIKEIEDFTGEEEVYGKCGNAPEINKQNITDKSQRLGSRTTIVPSPYKKWITCTKSFVDLYGRFKKAQDELVTTKDVLEVIGYPLSDTLIGLCGVAPILDVDKTSIEVEKLELKVKIWRGCVENEMRDLKTTTDTKELILDIEDIQLKSSYYKIQSLLSEVCPQTDRFINMSRDQIFSYSNSLEIRSWVQCIRQRSRPIIQNAQAILEYNERLKNLEKNTLNKKENLIKDYKTPAPVNDKKEESLLVEDVPTTVEESKSLKKESPIVFFLKRFSTLFNFKINK